MAFRARSVVPPAGARYHRAVPCTALPAPDVTDAQKDALIARLTGGDVAELIVTPWRGVLAVRE